MNVILKDGNKEAESGDQMKKITEYHLLNQNARWLYGRDLFKWKISLRFFNENMNAELYGDILKD